MEIIHFILHVEDGFFILKQTKDKMYIKITFYFKNFTKLTGQFSYKTFQPFASEQSWQSSPSTHVSFFKPCDFETVPPVAFVHDDKDRGRWLIMKSKHYDQQISIVLTLVNV